MGIALHLHGHLVGHFKASHGLQNGKLQSNCVILVTPEAQLVAKETPWHKSDLT